ncbi:hypothetical protein HMPREF9700_00279 [Bergeyella zoohelcum CCUG 30536]|uniref:Uncharacterized protein n=1 Tax=Bergeyella zoohelcum TaxID=1015 RepID=A0A376BZY0_9FLAO|nr:hypothetical protein HMPREF9700_00279 [Bergeyella zoohelcum CCUG 30536]SSZ47125.1 Uncharacterised protein [Bergeyella zoohelcum]
MKKAIRICLVVAIVVNTFLLALFIKKEQLFSSVILSFSLGFSLSACIYTLIEEQSYDS